MILLGQETIETSSQVDDIMIQLIY